MHAGDRKYVVQRKRYRYLCSLPRVNSRWLSWGQLSGVQTPNPWLCSLHCDISVKWAWPLRVPLNLLLSEGRHTSRSGTEAAGFKNAGCLRVPLWPPCPAFFSSRPHLLPASAAPVIVHPLSGHSSRLQALLWLSKQRKWPQGSEVWEMAPG